MTNWIYKDKEFIEQPEKEYEGFVYIIHNKNTDKYYIGKKTFWSRRKKKPTDKRRTTLPSDWKRYYGSNDILKAEVKESKENIDRYILALCERKGQMTYIETKLQFSLSVLEQPEKFYNNNINGKYYTKQAEGLPSIDSDVLNNINI